MYVCTCLDDVHGKTYWALVVLNKCPLMFNMSHVNKLKLHVPIIN